MQNVAFHAGMLDIFRSVVILNSFLVQPSIEQKHIREFGIKPERNGMRINEIFHDNIFNSRKCVRLKADATVGVAQKVPSSSKLLTK